MPQGNSPESEFEPSKASLNSSSFLVRLFLESSRSSSGQFLPIAFVNWNATLYASSSKVASYRFRIISSISQNFYWSVSRSSYTCIDFNATDDLLKSSAIMLISRTYNYCQRNRIWTDNCMSLHSFAALMSVVFRRYAAFFESMNVLSTATVTRSSLPSV